VNTKREWVLVLSRTIELLKELSSAFGPPGNEEDVAAILKKELEELADETRIDKLGNVFFCHEGKEGNPKIMLSAHMDEIGFIVTFVEKMGSCVLTLSEG
jgi:putative aminopeptidase FrvX